MVDTNVLIVGGGLAGLSAAYALAGQGRDFLLVEARDRLGGRILSETFGDGRFDLGPAWFWPGQPRIASLIGALGLSAFPQYGSGDLLIEDANGAVQRTVNTVSMQGSMRVMGGLASVIEALVERLPQDRIKQKMPVKALTKTDQGVRATTEDGKTLLARQVILTIPPRLAHLLAFDPPLPLEASYALGSIPTWMAGHAKAVAIYNQPFWRDAGLSGDAMSHRGPMLEIPDASSAADGPYALFGFLGVPPHMRKDAEGLRQAILDQLGRIFGKAAAAPSKVLFKDWSFDLYTATPADHHPQNAHPHYGLPASLTNLWDGRLIMGGTEVAPQFGGFLEGALEAAESAVAHLQRINA